MNGECEGKVIFITFWRAQRAARNLNRHAGNSRANAYRCPNSKHFHVGNSMHSASRKRRYMRRRYV